MSPPSRHANRVLPDPRDLPDPPVLLDLLDLLDLLGLPDLLGPMGPLDLPVRLPTHARAGIWL